MKKFVIITDTSCDMQKELREKYDIEYVAMRYIYNNRDIEANLDWIHLPPKDFYDIMRGGTRIRTAAVNTQAYVEAFEEYLKQGYDVLSISTAVALSTSVNSAKAAKEELQPKYPDSKIICIDSCNACGGLGILCMKASKLRAEGKSIEEAAAWVEENKKYINQEGTVEKLIWLKQAGRVSAASAFFGDLLAVKPLICSDIHGYNVPVEKVKGRKRSLARVAERVAENYLPNDMGISIRHADCLEEAIALKEDIQKRLGLADEQFDINYIGPAIGASVGPGMVGVYFLGKEVTLDSLAEK
ncbi:MAG: DegV family protein [Clostridia bacterium]|nr:DegV family protein [Clostridia bacterium]